MYRKKKKSSVKVGKYIATLTGNSTLPTPFYVNHIGNNIYSNMGMASIPHSNGGKVRTLCVLKGKKSTQRIDL